jgi:hypothetical protein
VTSSYPRRLGAWLIDVVLIDAIFIGVAVALQTVVIGVRRTREVPPPRLFDVDAG